jgi:hypothetical protein
MIRMIMGWTMIEADGNHSVHSIKKITVPDHVLASLRDSLLPKLMRGEVREGCGG